LAVRAPVEALPLIAFAPDQAPDAAQLLALLTDHVNVELVPLVMLLGAAVSVTTGAGVLMLTVAACAALPPGPVQVSV
jgi:hypothetical protein